MRVPENKLISHSEIVETSLENVFDKNVKLIQELEKNEKMKTIRKREDERQKRYDIVRYIREHGSSSQRDSKICQSHHTRVCI